MAMQQDQQDHQLAVAKASGQPQMNGPQKPSAQKPVGNAAAQKPAQRAGVNKKAKAAKNPTGGPKPVKKAP